MSDAVQNDWMSHQYPMGWLQYSAREKIASHIDGSIGSESGYMMLADLLGFDIDTSYTIHQRSVGNPLVSGSPTIFLLQKYGEKGGTIQVLQKALLQMKHVAAAAVIPTYIPRIENSHQQTGSTNVADTKCSQCNHQECTQRQSFNVNCHPSFVSESESINPNLSPRKNIKSASCDNNVPSDQNMDQPTKKEQRPAYLSKCVHQIINEGNTSKSTEGNGSERNITFRPTPLGSSETDSTVFITCSNPQDDKETFVKSVVTSRMESCGVLCINETMAHHHCVNNLMAAIPSESRRVDKSFSLRHSWHDQCDHLFTKSSLRQFSSDSLLISAPKLRHAHIPERDFEGSYNQVASNTDGRRHNCDQNFVENHFQSSNIQNQTSSSNISCVNTNGPQHSHDQRNNRDRFVFVTYSYNSLVEGEPFLEELVNLCQKLREAVGRVRIDMDADSYKMHGVNKINWIARMFREASFIIACVTPTYASDVQPPTGIKANPSESPLNAHYIYKMICGEYVQNQCQNYRVIPVLFKHSGANITHVPPCMLPTPVYSIPNDIEKIVSRVI